MKHIKSCNVIENDRSRASQAAIFQAIGTKPPGRMAVSVSIKKTRDPREKYVFSASQPKRATEETNVRVKRVAEEIAKYLAVQFVEQDNFNK